MPKIKHYIAKFLLPLGNYSSETVGFCFSLEEGEDLTEVYRQFRARACELVGRKTDQLYTEKYRLEGEIRDLSEKVAAMRTEYCNLREFLITQGIKPDMPAIPQLNNLLTAAKVEEEALVEGEFDDSDADDESEAFGHYMEGNEDD